MSGPRYQHFHPLAASQYEQLKSDIEQKGVLVPIIVDENGNVIDGHQRRRICAELHMECPQRVLEGLDDNEKHALSIVLNVFRRHLTGSERQPALAELGRLGWSARRIGEAVGVSHQTVLRSMKSVGPDGPTETPPGVDPETGEVLSGHGSVEDHDAEPGLLTDQAASSSAGGEARGETDTPSPRPTQKVKGKDGKSYPAAKPAPTRREEPPTAEEIVERFSKGRTAFFDKVVVHDAAEVVDAYVATGQMERVHDFVTALRKYADEMEARLREATKVKAV